MESFAHFLFWTSFYFLVPGLLYILFLKGRAKPDFNRFFILLGLMVSVILGTGIFVPVGTTGVSPNAGITLPVFILDTSGSLESGWSLLYRWISASELLVYTALLISTVFAVRMMSGFVSLFSRVWNCPSRNILGMKVIAVSDTLSPFSFFHWIFIPERLLSQPGIDKILIHERTHSRLLHSVDLLFVELLTLIFWFHPVVWFLRRELKLQHEFEADQAVVASMGNAFEYQHLLLNLSFSGFYIPVTHPLNYSPLKKRIMMMNKNHPNAFAPRLFSLVFALAVFSGLFFLQACGDQAGQQENRLKSPPNLVDEQVDLNETVFTEVEDPPQFPGGETARIKFMMENLKYPEASRKAGVQGTVFVSFIVKNDGKIEDPKILRGVNEEIDKEVLRILGLMPDWIPGKQRGENVNVAFNMPVRFALN